ncbi:AraC family transcriptional regulator [Epibacterium ulvae]|uniref:AraC family transcriptional regulator n=1 Tax=Epibacterium ulvae TaxID=1156985 RepID=UPI002490DEE9|nr:AraC family transcriptional regulator [Epibacterium ulvae]
MTRSYEDRIQRVITYIHDHPDEDLSLDRLAAIAAMSRFHWHRVFRALTQETCAQMVRRIRMHRASIALVKGDDSIEAIARAVGYPNVASFTRRFSEAYGHSPAAFRAAGQLCAPQPYLRPGDYPMYSVEIREVPARILSVLPHVGPYNDIGLAFEKFYGLCASRNLWANIGVSIGVYVDSPETVPETELRSFAGAEWKGQEVPEGTQRFDLVARRVAVLTYQGPYSGISAAYNSLFGNWLPVSGEEPADAPCYELYLNSPRDVSPEELLTEIHLPLA